MNSDIATRTASRPTGWYAAISVKEKRTFWACFGGWALDAMDVQIFSFVIPAIIIAFAITNADAGLIGTVTLLTSAFGGWFAGALADRFGRVRTLQITILWFAFFTLLCGFAQNYTQLLIFRALMGVGFGGEWAAGAVLMGEVIRAQHRGKAVGSVFALAVWAASGYLAIVIIGSFVGYLVSAYLADRIGRRANFILFAVCSVVTVLVYTHGYDDALLGLPARLFRL